MIIEEAGRVVALEADSVWVVTQRRSTCSSCSANKACGTGILARAFSAERQIKIKVPNSVDARIGDDVILGIDDRVMLRGALLMYLLPLLALLFGAFIAKIIAENLLLDGADLISALSGLSAMVLVFVYLRRYNHMLGSKDHYHPHILRLGT